MWGFWECWSGRVILYWFSYKGLTGLLGFTTLLSSIRNRTQHVRNWICFHLQVEKWGDSAFCWLERPTWFSVWDSCYCFMWLHMMQPAIVLLWLYSKIQTVWSPSLLPQLLHSLRGCSKAALLQRLMTETGTPLTVKNCMLTSLFSCLVPKNMTKMCKTLYECDTWSYLPDLEGKKLFWCCFSTG